MSSAQTSNAMRAEVIEHLADLLATASESKPDGGGLAAIAAVRARYPDTPQRVLVSAWGLVLRRREDEWWRSLERTIDGEVVRSALAKPDSSR